MGYRDFRDSSGTEWHAWDVFPQLAERRHGSRRLSGHGANARFGKDDRRRGIDRRMVTSRRATLDKDYSHGWLCFETPGEKRRLTPIPADWIRCRDAELEAYCRQATRVRSSAADSNGWRVTLQSDGELTI